MGMCTPPHCFYPQMNPKQKTFAIDSLSSIPIRLGNCNVPYVGPCYGEGCWKIGKTCGKRTGTAGMGAMPIVGVLGVVLRIPCRGLFMCPLAVAELELRYLSINFSLIFWQPRRKPCRVAFSSVEIFGLHNNWCTNFPAFPLVCTECVNTAIWGSSDAWGLRCDVFTWSSLLIMSSAALIGNIHKSMEGSFVPHKITLLLLITLQYFLVNNTLHPALHRTRMPIKDAINNLGTMWLK